MNTILITGAGGFIASHVIEEASSRGYKVVGNMRFLPHAFPKYLTEVDIYNIDNRDHVGMRSIIEKVDGVINLAGILGTRNTRNWRDFYENNVWGAWSVMDACMEFATPMVQIAVGNYFETNLYSNTKTAIERDVIMNVRYNGLRASVVRGLNAYGPRQKVNNTGKIIPTFISKALNNEPLQVYGGKNECGIMDMIYVKDLANILLNTLELTSNSKGENPIMDSSDYHTHIIDAGTGIGHSVYDIAKRIVDLSSSSSSIEEVPMRPGESKRSEVVAKSPYPYAYTSLDEGLKETINYYRKYYGDTIKKKQENKYF